MNNVTLTFRVVHGGGSIAEVVQVSDGQGEASGRWTLGTHVPDMQQVEVRVGDSLPRLHLGATVVAGPAAQVRWHAGDGQVTLPGTAVDVPPAVILLDRYGNPTPGIGVTFAVDRGAVTGAAATTNADGVAAVGSWTVGPTNGVDSLQATVRLAETDVHVFVRATVGSCNCWSERPPLPTPRAGLAAAELNGKLYVLGGYNGVHTYENTLEEYDPTTNRWTSRAPMPTARWGLGLAAIGGKLYAIGGSRTAGQVGTLEVYDPATDTWTTKTPMPTVRLSPGVAVVNGVLYVIGGWVNNGGPNTHLGRLSTVEAYDPATDRWTTKAPMPTPRYALGVAAVDGVIYAIGGEHGFDVVRTVEAYDPATDRWTTRTPMPVGRYVFGIGVLHGKIYVAAGSDEAFTTIAYLKHYDPKTDSWSYDKPLAQPRREHAAAAVRGRLYVVGGQPNSGTPSQYPTSVPSYQP